MSKKLIFFLVSVLLAGLFCTAAFAGKTVKLSLEHGEVLREMLL